MTPFATITPTRGDRPELLSFCKYQLSRMTVKPDRSYFIDYKPTSAKVDLVERVYKGVGMAHQAGYDYIFIIEDDDMYPVNYFESFDIGNYLFYGSEQTTYYHLKSKTYSFLSHPNRSSLFISGFNITGLEGFNWHTSRNRFLDISLWEHAERKSKQFVNTGAIGMKHGLGMCAGKGHANKGANTDDDLKYLRAWADDEQFQFYSDLMKRL